MNTITPSLSYNQQSFFKKNLINKHDTISEIERQSLTPELETTISLNNIIANVCCREGKYDEALEELDKVLKIKKIIFNPTHSEVTTTLKHMTNVHILKMVPVQADMEIHQNASDERTELFCLQNEASRQANRVFALYRMFLKEQIECTQDNGWELFKLVVGTHTAWEHVEDYCTKRQDLIQETRKPTWNSYLTLAKKNVISWEHAIQSFDPENKNINAGEDLIDFPFATLIWKGSKQEASGEIKEIRYLKTMYRYPFIRIEETRDVSGKPRPKTAVVADHLILTFSDPSHLKALINLCNSLGKSVSFSQASDAMTEQHGLFYFTPDFDTLEFPPVWLQEVLDKYNCSYEPNYLFLIDG